MSSEISEIIAKNNPQVTVEMFSEVASHQYHYENKSENIILHFRICHVF